MKIAPYLTSFKNLPAITPYSVAAGLAIGIIERLAESMSTPSRKAFIATSYIVLTAAASLYLGFPQAAIAFTTGFLANRLVEGIRAINHILHTGKKTDPAIAPHAPKQYRYIYVTGRNELEDMKKMEPLLKTQNHTILSYEELTDEQLKDPNSILIQWCGLTTRLPWSERNFINNKRSEIETQCGRKTLVFLLFGQRDTEINEYFSTNLMMDKSQLFAPLNSDSQGLKPEEVPQIQSRLDEILRNPDLLNPLLPKKPIP